MDQEENTKEIKELNELKENECDTLEMDILEELDENLEISEEKFENRMEVMEELKLEESQEDLSKKTKKSWKDKISTFKEKWAALPKKKKIILTIISLVVLFLMITGIVLFILHFNKAEKSSSVPDVILEEENYRYQNGTLILLDKKGNEIGKYECNNKNQETCYVAFYNDEDNFDEPKMQYEDGSKIKNRSKFFLEQYAWIYDNPEKEEGIITLYDFKNKNQMGEYKKIKSYHSLENKFIVQHISGEYSYIQISEEKEKAIFDSTYDYLGFIDSKENNNLFVSKRGEKWYLIDEEDNTLTKALTYSIKDYHNEKIKAVDEVGKYHLIDYNGAEIKDRTFEYIDLLENYILFIEDGNLKIEDYDGNKMSEETILIKNNNYLPIHTYSKDNKLIKTDKSYDISYQGSILVIEIYDETGMNLEKKSIYLNEGKLSSKLAYMNYFGGTLYFYQDKEKKNQIGTYACENKNSIGDDITSLSNCFPAYESYFQDNDLEPTQAGNLGVLPIYNGRYAFIMDSRNPENDPNIVLYDLKENATKSKYKSLDAGAYTKSHELSFVNANNTHIIAENKNGKVGIIRMNQNSVEGVKGFDFDHIERIELYYIVHNESGYQLMDHAGNMISKPVPNKIRNFNVDAGYLTVQDNSSKYYLYQMNSGKRLIDSGADYISLYQNYFGLVKDKQLTFYAYNNPKKALGEPVSLKQTNYYGEGILAYSVTINGTKAYVKVGNKNEYESQIVIQLKEGEENATTNE